ncbi:MAG TPA: NlpC/P60 family protein [Verrucomicrobiae bacterium]|jgi:cell wall-associated NlpC family hydrolase
MTSYFSSPERFKQLEAEAKKWVGTPFVAKAMVCGAGVDCVHLVAGIYIACGVFKKFMPGQYALDEGSHLKQSKVSAWFASQPNFTKVTDLQPGDAALMNLALVGHHMALILPGNQAIHAFPNRKVMVADLRQSFYRKAIVEIYRPTGGVA